MGPYGVGPSGRRVAGTPLKRGRTARFRGRARPGAEERRGPYRMDSSRPVEAPSLSPDAIDFVRFCYRRRKVGWPELYDEMCAVAGRGLYRGWRFAELEEHGIGFSLHQTLELARIAGQVASEEGDRRGRVGRPAAHAVEPTAADAIEVRIAAVPDEPVIDVPILAASEPTPAEPAIVAVGVVASPSGRPSPRRRAEPASAEPVVAPAGGSSPTPARAVPLDDQECRNRDLSQSPEAGRRTGLIPGPPSPGRGSCLVCGWGPVPSGEVSDGRRRTSGAGPSGRQARIRRRAISPSIWRSAST